MCGALPPEDLSTTSRTGDAKIESNYRLGERGVLYSYGVIQAWIKVYLILEIRREGISEVWDLQKGWASIDGYGREISACSGCCRQETSG